MQIDAAQACAKARTGVALAAQAMVLLLLGGPAQLVAQTAASERDSVALEEVVVTAQKRAEDIQSVPMSITALTGSMLQAIGAKNFEDVAHTVPGLSFSNAIPGQETVTMRGVAANSGDATVAFYLDDIPLPSGGAGAGSQVAQSLGGPDPRIFDINRVEVLRGPQGTLYGASSMGGTIRFVTNQPKLDRVEGNVAAELGSTDGAGGANYQGTAVVNVPVAADLAALRVGVMAGHMGGFVDRLNLDGGNPHSNTDSSDYIIARITGLIQIGDSLAIKPLLLFQDNRLNDLPAYVTSLPQFHNLAAFPETQTDKTRLVGLAITKDFGPAELTSVTSVNKRQLNLRNDYGNFIYGIIAPILSGIDPALGPLALHYRTDIQIPNIDDTVLQQSAQEFRIASTSKTSPLQWLFGAYFAHTSLRFRQSIITPGFDAVGNTYLAPLFGVNPFNTTDDTPFKALTSVFSDEYAPFADMTYRFTSQWSVSAGVRWFKDRRTRTRWSGGLFDAGPGIFVDQPVRKNTESGTDPRVSINYQITPENLVYVSAAKGFRPGGANTAIPNNPQCTTDIAAYKTQTGRSVSDVYGPDSVWSYEVGSKNTLADGRMIANATAFYLNWTDIQQNLNLDDYGGAVCGFGFTDNIGKAASKGGELELQARVTRALTAGASASYVNAQVSSGPNSGQRVENVPDWSFNVNMNYAVPLVRDWRGSFHFDTSYTGRSTRNFTPITSYHIADHYTLTNARFILQKERWEVALFATNLFGARTPLDEALGPLNATAARIAGEAPYNVRTTLRPRTVGVSITFDF
jgi:outer membrane receptor protein involved in Fe transport